jgi:hypothetical protein
VATLAGKKSISIYDAWEGVVAARQVLGLMKSQVTSASAVAAYSRLLRLNTNEMARIIGDEWRSRSAHYKLYTEAFRHAAEELAKRNALELVDGMNLAAVVFGAFSKLVSAVSAAPPAG